MGKIGLITSSTIIVCIIVYAYIISLFTPTDPRQWNVVPRDQPPSLQYPFGTTTLGQDLFWLCSHAFRNSVTMAILTGLIGIGIAMTLGIIGGYVRGKVFSIMTMFIDAFCVMPALPILVFLLSLWREKITILTMSLAIAVFSWAWPSRTFRSLIISLRERTFIYTANFSGYSLIDLIKYHYLPYMFGLILVSLINIMLWTIGLETTLAVFGLISLTEPTIGLVIFWAMNYLAIPRGIWWWIASPVALLIVFIVSLYHISLEIYGKYLMV